MKVTAIHIVKDGIIVAQIVLPGHKNELSYSSADGYEVNVMRLQKDDK